MRLMAAVILGVMVGACGPTEREKSEAATAKAKAEAEAADAAIRDVGISGTRETFRDPEGANFRKVFLRPLEETPKAKKLGNKFTAVCGEVNAKNAYGGYVGYAPFAAIVRLNSGKLNWEQTWTATASKDDLETMMYRYFCFGEDIPET